MYEKLTELPFMLEGKVFRSAMPYSNYDFNGEIYPAYKKNSISMVVMLTSGDEALSITGKDIAAMYKQDGLKLIHYPIEDYSVPEISAELPKLVEEAIEHAQAGGNLAVHCHAGIGRAGVFLAIMARKVFQMEGQEAVNWLRTFIPDACQTNSQVKFVKNTL